MRKTTVVRELQESAGICCEDMRSFGLETLYLITDHTGFYERYGWKFLCMAQGDGEVDLSRMYVYDLK